MFVHETLRVVYRNRVVVDTVCAGCQAALDAVWEYLDVDQSGTIEADEFVAWWPPQVPRVRLRSPLPAMSCAGRRLTTPVPAGCRRVRAASRYPLRARAGQC